MATARLIGNQYSGGSSALASNSFGLFKFTALNTGIVSQLLIYSPYSGNAKIALYEDNAGSPGARIAANNEGQACTASQWNTLTIPDAYVTKDTSYWLAAITSAAGVVGRSSSTGGTVRYRGETYSSFTFPNPAGSGFGSATNLACIAGWGVLVLTTSGISQPISIGGPTVELGAAEQTIIPSGIAQAVAIGEPGLTYPQTIAPSGIAQALALGTPQLNLTLQTQGTLQTIAIGSPIITQPQLYESYAEESAYQNVYNNYWLCQTFTPQSTHKITSLKLKLCRVGSPGTGTVSIKVTDVDGKPTGGDLCSGSIDGNSLPESPEKLGFSLGAGTNLQASTKYAIVFRFPSGNSSNYGRTRRMYPGAYAGGAAVTSNDSGSTWEVVTDWDFVFEDWGEPLMQTIYPEGVEQPVVYGSPIVYFVGTVYPSGIAQQVAFGVPTVLGGIPGGIIWTEGIVQPVAVGKPTLYKYVWHVVLDGQYATETPEKNRLFVIGRDDYGNPVYGTAVDSAELALVGERLDFQQELAIPTTAQAESVASAILSKMRLNKARGIILIPPNCGQELFDTVQLSDAGANQSAVKFRVVGIRFEYNPKQAKYEHRLVLGAP